MFSILFSVPIGSLAAGVMRQTAIGTLLIQWLLSLAGLFQAWTGRQLEKFPSSLPDKTYNCYRLISRTSHHGDFSTSRYFGDSDGRLTKLPKPPTLSRRWSFHL